MIDYNWFLFGAKMSLSSKSRLLASELYFCVNDFWIGFQITQIVMSQNIMVGSTSFTIKFLVTFAHSRSTQLLGLI